MRGATLLAFAKVEWFLAEIILEAASFEQYAWLDLSFTQDAQKRADKVETQLNVKGPFSPYADKLRTAIDASRAPKFCCPWSARSAGPGQLLSFISHPPQDLSDVQGRRID